MVEKITQPLTPLQNTEKINEIIDNFADKNLSNLSATGQQILDNKVDYDAAVLKSGDTMTGPLTVSPYAGNDGTGFTIMDPNKERGVAAPDGSNGINTLQRFVDKNGKSLGFIKHVTYSTGKVEFMLGCEDYRSNQTTSYGTNSIILSSSSNGWVVEHPEPPTDANYNESATTRWVRNVCVGNPNYNAAVSRTVGTTYTAATNGWVRVDSVQRDNTICKLIIDGKHTPYQVFCGEYFDGNIAVIIPVVKGQKYKGENLVSMWWYPSI